MTAGLGPHPLHRAMVRRERRLTLGMLVGSVAGAVLAACAAVSGRGPLEAAALVGAVSLFFLLLSLLALREKDAVRLVPYFRGQAPGGETFASGDAAAACLLDLDALAAARGLEPLSRFGFADDRLGETVTWHPAEAGLRTVSGLLEALRREPEAVPRAARVIPELERIERRLGGAADAGIPFALLLRHGGGVSGHEMDLRHGSF